MKLKTPINKQDIVNMKAGDIIYFSGVIYTGRDSAHKKMTEAKFCINFKNILI